MVNNTFPSNTRPAYYKPSKTYVKGTYVKQHIRGKSIIQPTKRSSHFRNNNGIKTF